MMRDQPQPAAKRHRFAAALLCASGGALYLSTEHSPIKATLFDPSLATGWSLIVLLAALCACVWSPRRSLSALSLQLRWVALLTGLALALFGGHIQSFPPTGVLDQILAWIFVVLLVSSGWGYHLSCLLEDNPTRARRRRFRLWLYLQAMVLGLLIGGGLVHGMLIHTHGLMARVLRG